MKVNIDGFWVLSILLVSVLGLHLLLLANVPGGIDDVGSMVGIMLE